MRTKEINAIVERAYTALDVLNNIKWTRYRDRCFDLACEEERQHRRGAPTGWRWPKGASVQAAARMFVVKRIAEALTDKKQPTVADFIHWQRSAFYAHSLAANFRAEIVKAWSGQDLAALAALDYVQFVNDGSKS